MRLTRRVRAVALATGDHVAQRARRYTIAMSNTAIVAAGSSPARNRAPVESEVTEPSARIAMLGGIDFPIAAEAASTDAASALS